MVDVAQNRNIELLSYSEVKEVSGYIGNFTVKIMRKPRYVKEGVCTGCGECVNVCPVSLPSEWDEGLATRKAIYRAFPQAVPITFCIDKKDRAPCVITCPAGINVQGYVQLIGQGKYRQAIELIMQRLPLPGVLGRVCPHPCETQCARADVDTAVAIRDLKRFAADQVEPETLPIPPIEDRSEKVAVVGSGPAGLTVAYYLRLKGYRVTIFEALQELPACCGWAYRITGCQPGYWNAKSATFCTWGWMCAPGCDLAVISPWMILNRKVMQQFFSVWALTVP
jgi:heterodisulfide reductase subunit A